MALQALGGISMAQPQALPFARPDLYQLSGGGISVTYCPIHAGGLSHFTYHDPRQTQNFIGNQIRTVEVPDLGTVVSVTLAITVDSGSTTFSVLLPTVNLPNQPGASVFIRTAGITTLHRLSIVPGLNFGQQEIYTVTPLTGTASLVLTSFYPGTVVTEVAPEVRPGTIHEAAPAARSGTIHEAAPAARPEVVTEVAPPPSERAPYTGRPEAVTEVAPEVRRPGTTRQTTRRPETVTEVAPEVRRPETEDK
jgi:hypothetical protein